MALRSQAYLANGELPQVRAWLGLWESLTFSCPWNLERAQALKAAERAPALARAGRSETLHHVPACPSRCASSGASRRTPRRRSRLKAENCLQSQGRQRAVRSALPGPVAPSRGDREAPSAGAGRWDGTCRLGRLLERVEGQDPGSARIPGLRHGAG